jgi:hypothetical protein
MRRSSSVRTAIAGYGLFLAFSAPCSGEPEISEESGTFALATGAVAPGDESLDSSAAAFSGNPMASALSWWPEDLVLAPIPGYSPEFGWTLALTGGYFLELAGAESEATPSLIGAFGMTSENESSAYGAGGRFHLLDDHLRINAGVGWLDFQYRFWGIGDDAGNEGRSRDIRQRGSIAYLAAQWELLPDLYVGAGYLNGSTEVTLKAGETTIPGLVDPTIDVDLAALQVPVDFDTRNDEYFPRNGWLTSLRASIYRESLGSDFDTEVVSLAVNRYVPIRDRDVLALRFYFRSAGDDAPFFLLSSFGGKTDLRGYEVGRYRDELMYTTQAEYRFRYSERWVLTGFLGVGEVSDSFDGFLDNMLPAAGLGVRYVLSQKHQISLSFDLSLGRNGSQFYFGVGEAF